MADFPIGSFLYWRLEQKNKTNGRFTNSLETSTESLHNPPVNMAGITKDISVWTAAAYHVTKHRFERILPLLLLSMENHTPLSQPAQGASGKCREPR